MMDFWTYPMLIPRIPNTNEKPPTIYAILNSYVNFGKDFLEEEYVSPTKLAEKGQNAIFDFDYPLSNNIKRSDFQKMILNKFMMRRIGYETLPAFKIALYVKLNEIMPKYNILFDAINGWNLFSDGDEETRLYTEKRIDSGTSQNEMINESTNDSTNTSDRRYNNTPENQIADVKSGAYLTEYNFDTDEVSSTTNVTSTNNGTNENNTNVEINETIKHSPSDKLKLYKEFMESSHNIYEMIFKDLSVLFYGVL